MSDPVATPVSLPSHDTATCSGWKTRGMLNLTEAPGRGYQEPKEHGMEERTGHAGVWDTAVYIHIPACWGDILGCKVTLPRTTLGSSSWQSFATQPGASLLCQALPRGPTIARHLPPSPPLAAKSTTALRDAGENWEKLEMIGSPLPSPSAGFTSRGRAAHPHTRPRASPGPSHGTGGGGRARLGAVGSTPF